MMGFCVLLCRSMLLLGCCCYCWWYFGVCRNCSMSIPLLINCTFNNTKTHFWINRWNRNALKNTTTGNAEKIIWGLESNYWKFISGWKMKSFYSEISLPLTHSKIKTKKNESAFNPTHREKHCTILQTIWLFYFTFACFCFCHFFFSLKIRGKKTRCMDIAKNCEFQPIAFSFFYVSCLHGACCCRVIRWQQNGK